MVRFLFTTLLCAMVFTAADARWKTRTKTTSPPSQAIEGNKEENKNEFDVNKNLEKTSDNREIFEGDIVMTKKLDRYIAKKKGDPLSEDSPFDAISNGEWTDGIIPYEFESGFEFVKIVNEAISEYHKWTCIKFVKRDRTKHRNYIRFIKGEGCYSYVGRQGGQQVISLGDGCGFKGTAIHELMHALGFFHEQSRLDRDDYIKVNFGNIDKKYWSNFEKYRPGQASTLGESYDKKSIMHYGNYYFSNNGEMTIESRDDPNETFGQRDGFSKIDIKQLRKYYRCDKIVQTTKAPTTTTTTTTRRTTRRTTRKTTKETGGSGGCTDSSTFCPYLAGYCDQLFIRTECKKTCKDPSCTVTTASPCVNKNANCEGWARRNRHCNVFEGCCDPRTPYATFMRRDCAKACGFC